MKHIPIYPDKFPASRAERHVSIQNLINQAIITL